MLEFLIIAFVIGLLYLSEIEIIRNYVYLLSFQGFLLFSVASLELKDLDWLNFGFILIETLIVKALFVPYLLHRIARRTQIRRNNKVFLRGNASVVIATLIVILSFSLAHWLHDEGLQVKYFAAAISSLLIGLYVGINHKDLITHIISFLIIEDGLFMLSLALGTEMPMLVNTAILLDVFGSFLVMGIFFNRVMIHFKDAQTDELTALKD
jgi:hydrogenase-4 component E